MVDLKQATTDITYSVQLECLKKKQLQASKIVDWFFLGKYILTEES